MAFKYRLTEGHVHFVMMTVVNWIDVFTRKNHKLTIFNSLEHCQQNKGLELYCWCLMPSHLHMIISCEEGHNLSDFLRDFKKFTSKQIVEAIVEEPESRREWMLGKFEFVGRYKSKIKNYQFWQEGNHPIEIHSAEFCYQKMDYIHNNPVEEMFVASPEEYLFSSSKNYADSKGLLDVILIPRY